MKIISPLLLAVLIFAGLTWPGRAGAVQAYLIADMQTGQILEGSNWDRQLQVASLTKVATAMVVLDWLEMSGTGSDQMASVPNDAFAFGGPNAMELRPGEQISLRDLLYACLLQSDNIAAETLAQHVGLALLRSGAAGGGQVSPNEAFVRQMNALAEKLGMRNTRFLNAYGGDWAERRPPHSTAADMARLTRYAMNRAAFRFYVSQPERRISILGSEGARQYLLRNTNDLLGREGVDGVKTGRTRLAGDCLILSAERSPITEKVGEQTFVTPRRLLVVLLGSQDRNRDGAALVDRGWALYERWASEGRPLTASRMLD